MTEHQKPTTDAYREGWERTFRCCPAPAPAEGFCAACGEQAPRRRSFQDEVLDRIEILHDTQRGPGPFGVIADTGEDLEEFELGPAEKCHAHER